MMGWYSGGMGWAGWILMTLLMLAFWALVVGALVAIFRGVGKSSRPVERNDDRDPLDILADRFARGEIDAETFEAGAQALLEAREGVRYQTPH